MRDCGTVNFSHPEGRLPNLFLAYRVQFQDSNTGFCVGTTCGKSFVWHSPQMV
jgi:hypothetical protein